MKGRWSMTRTQRVGKVHVNTYEEYLRPGEPTVNENY